MSFRYIFDVNAFVISDKNRFIAEPLTYLHGAGNIIPGLENELVGKVGGDSLQVKVEPTEGYGELNPELIQVVDKAAFQGVESVEAGMSFEARASDGSVQQIEVKNIDGEKVAIDANHPLAGVTLHYDVEIISQCQRSCRRRNQPWLCSLVRPSV